MSITQASAHAATPVIGVLGGTGDQGRGLALRLAQAGHAVVLGSRDAQRAAEAATSLGHGITGADNADCARVCQIAIVAVPYAGHRELLQGLKAELTGKIVIDCVNPLGFDRDGPFVLAVPAGSAAQEAAEALPDSTVVGAFHNVSAVELLDPDRGTVECDVLILGDERNATDVVQDLVASIPGMRGIYAGRLRNAAQVEGLTANLISMNRRYKAHASIRVTDI